MILITTVRGMLLLDEKGTLTESIAFPGDAKDVATIFSSLWEGEVPDMLSQLAQRDIDRCDNHAIASWLGCKLLPLEERQVFCEGALRQIGEDLAASMEFQRDMTLSLVEQRLRTAASSKDLSISQATNAIDELDQTINLFTERLVEWYGIHFPELERLVVDNVQYCTLIAEHGQRENIPGNDIQAAAQQSVGVELSARDMEAIRSLAKQVVYLSTVRKDYTDYIEEGVRAVAPNLTELAGPLIAARLIALAGGLANLARKPASTVQVLGAEKALFRHLKTGAKPPKHGIIFQHPLVHTAKPWQSGKIARTLASELAIAARVDYHSGNMVASELQARIDARVEEVRKKHQYPPRRKKKGRRKSR
jgi:nucleolar protein 56